MVIKFDPWGDGYVLQWDDSNREKLWMHAVCDSEIEECFENEHDVAPHPKAKSKPQKYGDRFYVMGVTDGGRKLVIIVQYLGANFIRPITAWDD